MQNHILQLLQQHGFVVEESGCWIGLPAVQIFHLQTWRIIKRKIRQRWPRTLQLLETYQARMGPNSNTTTPETHNLDVQTSSNCFEKKRRCYTMVNMPPSQLFWDLFKFEMSSFCLNICYVIYVLLKYWLMWFEILLVLILFKFKKMYRHFRNLCCTRKMKRSIAIINSTFFLIQLTQSHVHCTLSLGALTQLNSAS